MTDADRAAPATVDLLRHGSVQGGDCLRGSQDYPLDAAGLTQMRMAIGADESWQRIVSSPLSRCRVFADELANRDHSPLRLDPRWRELHFGDWEGRSVTRIHAEQPQQLEAFWRDPEAHPPPGGERLSAFSARIEQAWAELGRELQPGQRALLVTHAGVMRVLLCQVLGLPTAAQFRFELPHAARVTLVLDPRQTRLRFQPKIT